MAEKILIVDDEQEIADLVELYLKNENYQVYKFYTAQEALDCIETIELDLAILDIMLPDKSGLQICQKIRDKHTYPIIMLTAKNAEMDKITGLTLGADDYITKPFRPLRSVFEDLGLKNVKTVISSGNVIFESNSKNTQELEQTIEEILPEKLGFTSTTIVRSESQLKKLVEENPFIGLQDEQSSRFNVTFLKNSKKIDFKLPYESEGYKILQVKNGAVCTIVDLTATKTPLLMSFLEKEFGKEITTRTWKTVHRIMKKFDDNSN